MARRERDQGDRELSAVVAEARAAGRLGLESLKRFWLRAVCQHRFRSRLIRQDVFDAAEAAFGAGRREGNADG